MKTLILKKQDFLHKHPDIFAQLVWENNQCKVTVHQENKDSFLVSSAGSFGLISIPKG